jgi:predicted nuclease of predicted toxin-antitoxin system
MQHNNLEFWIDMNLPPAIAVWLADNFNVAAKSFVELNFHTTEDAAIFKKASLHPSVIVITTKDYDFVKILNELGGRPRVLYLNIGNVTNNQLKEILSIHFSQALKILTETDQVLVEISNSL